MQRKKPDVDVVLDILQMTLAHNPASTFVVSLHHQYQERGGLSKRQMEGLYQKALKVTSIPPNKLATLEAIILKKPTRYRSPLPEQAPLYTKDVETGSIIDSILAKYPAHKRVCFFKVKYDNDEPLTPAELAELKRFGKLLA